MPILADTTAPTPVVEEDAPTEIPKEDAPDVFSAVTEMSLRKEAFAELFALSQPMRVEF